MSALASPRPMRILWGSQGGTAQIFAMQLQEALEEEYDGVEVQTMGLNEFSPSEILKANALNILVVSVTGVGEPPENTREFYNYLMNDPTLPESLDYAVFGLGNSKAHPNQYNVIAKAIDKKLEENGGNRLYELGLGDDGDCIEEDFDIWMGKLVSSLSNGGANMPNWVQDVAGNHPDIAVVQAIERRESSRYQPLMLLPAANDAVREDLCDLASPYYQADFKKFLVTENRPLSIGAGEQSLREIVISTEGHDVQYEAGDHVMIYPKNSNCMVEAYEALIEIDPHSMIESGNLSSNYPHPTSLTIAETLTHCVDLSAVPSPAFARFLLGRKEIDYRNEVANPRRTALDLIHESNKIPSLEDLLYGLPALMPRYYSIASSPLANPDQIYLTYRPVKYVSTRGHLREGVCTSYLSTLGVGETGQSSVIASIRSNPSFRLPLDNLTPILLIAGGCGIAPIRSFLEDRLAGDHNSFGDSHLFVGFRSPGDEVYRPLMDKAAACGVIKDVQVSYSRGCVSAEQKCCFVSDTVRANSSVVWDLIEGGGHIYVCGGARGFGVSIEQELLSVFKEHKKMDLTEATDYLRELVKEGRLCEDISD